MRSSSSNSNKGFTILELLMGLTLTALLITMLFSALRLSQRSDEAGRAKQEQSQHMRIVTDRLTWLLRGAYPFFYKKDDKTLLAFDGEMDSLEFVTTSIDTFDQTLEDLAGLKKVKIFVDKDGLKISEQVFYEDMDEGGHEYVLDPQVLAISFEYLDQGDGESAAVWEDDWDTDRTVLPVAVKIKLKYKGDYASGKRSDFPEIVAYVHTAHPEKKQQ